MKNKLLDNRFFTTRVVDTPYGETLRYLRCKVCNTQSEAYNVNVFPLVDVVDHKIDCPVPAAESRHNTVRELKDKIKFLHQNFETISNERLELFRENSNQKELIEELRGKLKTTNEYCNITNELVVELETEINFLKQELQEELEVSKVRFNDSMQLCNENEALKEKLEVLNTKYTNLQSINSNLVSNNRFEQEKSEKLKSTIGMHEKTIHCITNENNKILDANKKLLATREILSKEIKDLKDQVKRKTILIQRYDKANAELIKEYNNLMIEYNQIIDEYNDLIDNKNVE